MPRRSCKGRGKLFQLPPSLCCHHHHHHHHKTLSDSSSSQTPWTRPWTFFSTMPTTITEFSTHTLIPFRTGQASDQTMYHDNIRGWQKSEIWSARKSLPLPILIPSRPISIHFEMTKRSIQQFAHLQWWYRRADTTRRMWRDIGGTESIEEKYQTVSYMPVLLDLSGAAVRGHIASYVCMRTCSFQIASCTITTLQLHSLDQ